tara:strand:+ start:773 stop:1258 length:486 start_codon:yes stop_codon:yes gene_type:complete
MVDGIEINQDAAENALLPDDLNSLAVGSYVVPNPNRRKYYPMYVLLIVVITYISSLLLPFINFNTSLIILVIVAFLLFLVNNKFQIYQEEVIERILKYIEHSIGYYSIALTFMFNFKNILTPVWTVIVYSHESPPQFKTIIEVNAYSGVLLDNPYTESLNA